MLEKHGQGLNLTLEVRDGILNHQTSCMPSTLEGKIVRISDKIAYIHHDMDDAIRAGILKDSDVPKSIGAVIGYTLPERLDSFIHDIITNSRGKNDITMSAPVAEAMRQMRQFMFENVYQNPIAKGEEGKAEVLIEALYEYYLNHFDKLPRETVELMDQDGSTKEQIVCDYVGAMTDRFAISKYEELFIPKTWHG